jgi:hypothetical protein
MTIGDLKQITEKMNDKDEVKICKRGVVLIKEKEEVYLWFRIYRNQLKKDFLKEGKQVPVATVLDMFKRLEEIIRYKRK